MHYPEAILLKQHTTQDVTRALVNVFSHFGFPLVILSDQGSDFVSALMQIFVNEFRIKQIRSSAYHPQTNRACERFNGTLKSMLHSLTDKFPDPWAFLRLPRSVSGGLQSFLSALRMICRRSSTWHGYKRPTFVAPSRTLLSLFLAPRNGCAMLLTLPTSR